MIRSLLSSLGVVLLVASLSGQTESRAKKKGPRKLSPDEVAQKLEKTKREVFEKMVSDRLEKKGKRRVKKWLDGFTTVQSEHYLVYTNGPKTTVKKFAKSLEKLYAFVKKEWPFEDVDHLLTAYIFNQAEEYYDFCEKIVGWSRRSAEATAGHANGSYYAAYYMSPKSDVVMHEATHQIVHACLGVYGVGSWFQEGMAVYIEEKIGNRKPSSAMRSAFRTGQFYRLRDFVQIPSLISNRNGNGSRNYEHAGALIDFLNNSKLPPVKGKFREFLAAAKKFQGRSRRSSERLIKKVYGLSLDELEAVWMKHHRVKNAKPKPRRR